MASNLSIALTIGAAVGSAIAGLKQVKSTLADLRNDTLSTSQKFKSAFKTSALGVTGTITGIQSTKNAILGIAEPAIKFESAMADVKKVVDFKTPEGFKNLSNDILDLTRTLPMSAEELATITAAGGQLGVAEADLKDFTTTIAKMSVAFDMSADASGEAMAKLANVYKIPIKEIGKLGDAINELSNSNPAKASDIVSTLGRIGGVAKQFGLTENAAAALSNSFISLGKSPEVAGTAINGMLTKLMTAEKGGKAFQNALSQVGISAKQLKANLAKDGQGALVAFLKRLEKLPKEKAMGVLVDLFGREYADDVAVLAGNVDVLEKSLSTLQDTDENGKPKYLGSMQKEFEARAATTENSLKLLGNSFTEMGIVLGNAFLPIITSVVSGLSPLIHGIADFIKQNQWVGETLAYVVLGVGGAFTAFSTLNAVVGIGSMGWLALGKSVGKTFGVIKWGWGILKAGGQIFSILSVGVLDLGITFAKKLWSGLKIAGQAFMWLTRIMMANPIIAIISLIGLAAYFIYDNWEAIAPWFSNLWQTVSGYFSQFWSWVQGIWSNVTGWVSSAWGGIGEFFGNLWTNIGNLFSQGIIHLGTFISNFNPLSLFQTAFSAVLSWFGIELPNSFAGFGKNIINGLVNGIKNAWDDAKEIVGNLGNNIKGWFAEKLGIHSPSRVFMGYGDNISQGLAIGVAQTAIQASDAVLAMGQQMKNAAPKTLDAPVMKPIKAAKVPKTTAPKVAKTLTLKTQTTMSAPMSAKNERLQYITRMQAQDKLQSAVKFEPVLNTVGTIAKPLLSNKKGLLGSLWDDIKFGANFVGNLLGLNQSSLKTPDFNPNANGQNSSMFSNYEPLNRKAVSHTENNSGIVVHFNPTIQVNGNQGKDGILADIQQGLNMSAEDLKRLIVETMRREQDQYRRRAY